MIKRGFWQTPSVVRSEITTASDTISPEKGVPNSRFSASSISGKKTMLPIMTIAIISERGLRAGEIVVAASTILTMTYLTVKPVSTNNTCRDEFINACRAMVRNGTPKKYMGRIAHPSSVNADYADFWLAFDTMGEQIARQLIQNSGKSVEKGNYDFPGMVHLFEHIVPDPPDNGDIKPWIGTFA
ncbi:MAG TPA: hypothetical protein VN843_16160, partial [Anaerolineales bacterium]|nr:hypothetical protein [Anaerolineales bacterium]